MKQYFGGTGITLEKLKEIMPTIGIDGTNYKIENWIKECEVFDSLIPGKSKVFIPYGGVYEFGTLSKVEWTKHEFKHYAHTSETADWWVSEPIAHVTRDGYEGDYYIYEISYYKNWRRKSQMKNLMIQREKPKRKFLSKEDIVKIKRDEVIQNSINKRNLVK